MNGHTSELTLPGLHRTAFPPALAPPDPHMLKPRQA